MTTQQETARVVTEPGVYDMSDAVYHGDPVPGGSLSSSGARRLLPPSCPARFRYEQTNPPDPKPAFEFGSAAHKLVLGVGPDIVQIDAENWRRKATEEEAEKARADGAIPLLKHEHEQAQAMADALRSHPFASVLFSPGSGKPEQALFWQDRTTGVWLRAKLDWLPDASTGRLIIPDYKTSKSADLGGIAHSIYQWRYFQQAAWYIDGARSLGLAEDVAFLFVFQEKTAPYLVSVVEVDATALRVGKDLNRRAIEIYRDCREADQWPGYTTEIELIRLPAWAETRLLEETT